MMVNYNFIFVLSAGMFVCSIEAQESLLTPGRYYFPTLGITSANGSSLNGDCSDITLNLNGTTSCATPTSSVIMDGVIPTLEGLFGDTWASSFLVMQSVSDTNNRFPFEIRFDFSEVLEFSFSGLADSVAEQIELVMFNCPEFGSATARIEIHDFTNPSQNLFSTLIETVYPTVLSCDSLVRICIPIRTRRAVTSIVFVPFPGSSFVHLAEVSFFNASVTTPCPAFTTIPGNVILPTQSPSMVTSSGVTSSGATSSSATQVPTVSSPAGSGNNGASSDGPQTDGQESSSGMSGSSNSGFQAGDGTATQAESSSGSSSSSSDGDAPIILSILALVVAVQTTIIFFVVLVVVCRERAAHAKGSASGKGSY